MMEVFDCEQGSPEWFACRMGIPTASEFACVMRTSGRAADGSSEERRTYLYTLAGEIVTGEPSESYSNSHMERGKVMEAEARSLYEFLCDAPLQRIGFIRNGRKGASPDSFVGNDGGVEFKTQLPHRLIQTILKDEFPNGFMAQCQGNIWCGERDWWDLAVYWPKMPLFAKRVPRDEKFISKLSDAVDRFNDELDAIVEKVKRYGVAA